MGPHWGETRNPVRVQGQGQRLPWCISAGPCQETQGLSQYTSHVLDLRPHPTWKLSKDLLSEHERIILLHSVRKTEKKQNNQWTTDISSLNRRGRGNFQWLPYQSASCLGASNIKLRKSRVLITLVNPGWSSQCALTVPPFSVYSA